MSSVMDRAAKLSSAELRRLAELEWRSRTGDWAAYVRSGTELGDVVTDPEFGQARGAAERLVERLRLSEVDEALAIATLTQTTLCAVLGDRLSRDARMYLGRAWRALLKEVGETS